MTPTLMLSSLACALAPTPLLKLPERIAAKLPGGGAEPPEHLVHGVSVPIRRPEHDLVLSGGADGQRLSGLESQPTADRHRDYDLPLGAHADDRRFPSHDGKSTMAYISWREPARQRCLVLERRPPRGGAVGHDARSTWSPSRSRCVTVRHSGRSQWSNLGRCTTSGVSVLPAWAKIGTGAGEVPRAA